MKLSQLKFKFVLIPILSLFITCSSGNKPGKTTEKFLEAIKTKDFTAARELSTPETGKLIDLMEQLQKVSNSTDSIAPIDYEIVSEKVEASGKEAVVEFREKGGQDIQQIRLKMIDGNWKVSFSKEDLARKNALGVEEGDSGVFETDTLQTLESPEDSVLDKPLP